MWSHASDPCVGGQQNAEAMGLPACGFDDAAPGLPLHARRTGEVRRATGGRRMSRGEGHATRDRSVRWCLSRMRRPTPKGRARLATLAPNRPSETLVSPALDAKGTSTRKVLAATANARGAGKNDAGRAGSLRNSDEPPARTDVRTRRTHSCLLRSWAVRVDAPAASRMIPLSCRAAGPARAALSVGGGGRRIATRG
jgi:hypothetical protein